MPQLLKFPKDNALPDFLTEEEKGDFLSNMLPTQRKLSGFGIKALNATYGQMGESEAFYRSWGTSFSAKRLLHKRNQKSDKKLVHRENSPL